MQASSKIVVDCELPWMNIIKNSRAVRIIDFKDLALMYDLEDYLNDVDLPLRAERDAAFILSTSTLKEVFYLSLVSVIKQHGVDYNDRFFNNNTFIPMDQLKCRTINGTREKTNPLDSLYDLLLFAYRRCSVSFKADLDALDNNRAYFYYFKTIFDTVYKMIVTGRGSTLKGNLHAKALLTTIMKAGTITAVKRYLYN